MYNFAANNIVRLFYHPKIFILRIFRINLMSQCNTFYFKWPYKNKTTHDWQWSYFIFCMAHLSFYASGLSHWLPLLPTELIQRALNVTHRRGNSSSTFNKAPHLNAKKVQPLYSEKFQFNFIVFHTGQKYIHSTQPLKNVKIQCFFKYQNKVFTLLL